MNSSLTNKDYKLYDIGHVRQYQTAIAEAALQTSGVASTVLNGIEWEGGKHEHDP